MASPEEANKEASPLHGSSPAETLNAASVDSVTEDEDGWDGPDDPENPRNWPSWKRIFHTMVPAVYTFGLCVGISTFVASVPAIQAEFNVSRNVALLPVSLYTAGIVIGPCIASPVSEIYGRRWIYWTNYPALMVFNAIAAASNNFAVLVVFRFLAGAFGSGVVAVGAGTLNDCWTVQKGAMAGIFYLLAPFMGPALGPLIGAYVIHHYNDWRWVVWVVLCVLSPVGVALFFMKETSKSRILYLRAKKRNTGYIEEMSFGQKAERIGRRILRPLHMLCMEPLSIVLGLYSAYSFAMIFSFFGSYALVYSTVYGFNQRQIGLCYIPVVVGFFFSIATFGYFYNTLYQREVRKTNGHPAPEHLFYAALVGSILIPIGLFWYAWAPRPSVHWIVPVLAGLPFGWGTLASFMSCITYLVDSYGVENAASAAAANGIMRFALAAVFPQFIIQVYQSDMGIHWVGSIFAFISVVMIPVPWLIFWKGRELRRMSHYKMNTN